MAGLLDQLKAGQSMLHAAAAAEEEVAGATCTDALLVAIRSVGFAASLGCGESLYDLQRPTLRKVTVEESASKKRMSVAPEAPSACAVRLLALFSAPRCRPAGIAAILARRVNLVAESDSSDSEWSD